MIKKHLHTTISEKNYKILKNIASNNGKSISSVLEEAIEMIHIKQIAQNKNTFKKKSEQRIEKSNLDEYKLAHLMLNDFNMMAVGRRTFLSYISSLPDEPMNENNAIELIEWFYNDKYQIKDLSLFQIVVALKKLWVAGNYFNDVKIQSIGISEPENCKKFKLIFYHDFSNKNYGIFWSQYFKITLRRDNLKIKVNNIVIRSQSFYLFVEEENSYT